MADEREIPDEEWRTETVQEASRILISWARQESPVTLELYSLPLFIKGYISVTDEDDPEPLEFHFTSVSGDISMWVVLSPHVSIKKTAAALLIDFGKNNLGSCKIWKTHPRRRDPWIH